jgi:ligand-binding SRPBCC domain-containing protein
MRIHVLEREQVLPGSPREVFPFFADAHNLEAITPPLLRFRVITPDPIELGVGTTIQYRLRLHGVGVNWLTSIQAWDPPHRFVDVQLRGPYALWHHTHTFTEIDAGPAAGSHVTARGAREADGTTRMRDVVRYALPLGSLGELAHRLFVRRDVEGIFSFRHDELARRVAASRGRGLQPVEDEVHAR